MTTTATIEPLPAWSPTAESEGVVIPFPDRRRPTESCARWYDAHARAFFDSTVGLDMSALHDEFLALVPAGGHVLDAACGSGRDARAFRERGCRVSAFDASCSMAQLASAHLGAPVTVRTFDDVHEVEAFDGVWVCAGLVHVPQERLPPTLARLWRAVRRGGCLYASIKHGRGQRFANGRLFTDADEETMAQWCATLVDVASCRIWLTGDCRLDKNQAWVNVLAYKAPA